MVEIRNKEDLERWLKERPSHWSTALAGRFALRLLPALGNHGNELFIFRNWRNRIWLPVIHSEIIADLLMKIGHHENLSQEIIHSRTLSAEYLAGSRNLYAVHRVIESISRLAHTGGDFFHGAIVRDAAYAVRYPFVQRIFTDQHQALHIHTIEIDMAALERGVDLWTQPLWLDDTPDWAIRGWETLATELTKRAPYWRTLVRWYEDRLHGDDWAAAQGRPAIPELEIARASLPDSYWKKGGKAVNEAIAKLEDYFWNGVEIDDPVLRELVGQTGDAGPDETQVAALEDMGEDIDADDGLVEPAPAPSPLPAQSHGPHFGLRDGLLDFAPPEHLDPAKNNVQRLRSLIPLLRAEVAAAIEIFGRNKAHGRIHDALASYNSLLEGDVTALNYDLLAGFGVKLQSEEAAALGAIADGLEPAFERSETAALKSVLDLHGPVILSTEAGQTFVADAERWTRNPRQEKQFRQSASKLAEAIEADGIATPTTARFVKDAAADVGLGPQPERSAVFGVGTIRNVSIALIAGAAVYVGANAVMSMDMTHWLYILLLNEGIKHSDVGKGTSGLISDAINDVTRGKALKKIYKFVLAHEAVIRRIAGKRREFSFLNDWLDWLKTNPPAE